MVVEQADLNQSAEQWIDPASRLWAPDPVLAWWFGRRCPWTIASGQNEESKPMEVEMEGIGWKSMGGIWIRVRDNRLLVGKESITGRPHLTMYHWAVG